MAMFKVKHKGNFKKTENFFKRALRRDWRRVLDAYGKRGVELLKAATPTDSGITAESWDYKIAEENGALSITWTNDNENKGANIVMLIVYGHGTKNGGYVAGNDFVTPAIQPLLDEMAQKVWKEVTK